MKRAFTLIEAVIVIAIVLVLAAFLFPLFVNRGSKGQAPRSPCQSNLKKIGLGLLQYNQDASERFPPVTARARGWADLIQPYVKSTEIFQCDRASNGATDSFTTDYFYNRRLARATLSQLDSSAQTIMAGDGEDNAPTWNSWKQLPADATTNELSPTRRHLLTSNYLFVDGHVKALKSSSNPSPISNSSPGASGGRATFAIQ